MMDKKYLVKLWINYWHGEIFVGAFESKKLAMNYYNANKYKFRDYAGGKHGCPYGIPIYEIVRREEA